MHAVPPPCRSRGTRTGSCVPCTPEAQGGLPQGHCTYAVRLTALGVPWHPRRHRGRPGLLRTRAVRPHDTAGAVPIDAHREARRRDRRFRPGRRL
eukprot:scaffold6801_cov63-Phaeocystis_antarctica.AAC.3